MDLVCVHIYGAVIINPTFVFVARRILWNKSKYELSVVHRSLQDTIAHSRLTDARRAELCEWKYIGLENALGNAFMVSRLCTMIPHFECR